jgi:amidohydrolase
MTDLKEFILKRSSELRDEITGFRRHFHMNPELAYEEHRTSEFIAKFLSDNGIPFRKGIAGTGIVAELQGRTHEGPVIGLRAEMDALPVTETSGKPWKSLNQGIMHACGHDAHMAMLMGTALLLNSLREHFSGKFLLIFQPGEELAPGGAKLMIGSGIFNELKPGMVIAQHVLPELETGKVGYRPGRYMASSDEIYITVRGKGGHAALPGLTTDQIYIASTLIVRLKDAMAAAKEKNKIPTVLGIGRIRGDGATNVIPEKVEIAGTFRTFDEKWRAEAKNLIKEISASAASEFSVSVDVNIVHGYPVLFNNEKLTERAAAYSAELLGSDNIEFFDLRMSSEDFAFFTEAFPSLYYRVGIRRKGEEMKMLHTPLFDIDEEGLGTGVANMTWLAMNFMTGTDKD